MATWVFDFDGTITLPGDDHRHLNSQPNRDVIAIMQRIRSSTNDKIIVFTARGMASLGNVEAADERWRLEIEGNLREWMVPYDRLQFGKPAADYYVDDKGVNVNDLSKLFQTRR